MTVEQLLRSTTSAELSEWLAYFQIENAGDTPTDLTEEDSWRRAFNAYG